MKHGSVEAWERGRVTMPRFTTPGMSWEPLLANAGCYYNPLALITPSPFHTDAAAAAAAAAAASAVAKLLFIYMCIQTYLYVYTNLPGQKSNNS